MPAQVPTTPQSVNDILVAQANVFAYAEAALPAGAPPVSQPLASFAQSAPAIPLPGAQAAPPFPVPGSSLLGAAFPFPQAAPTAAAPPVEGPPVVPPPVVTPRVGKLGSRQGV